MNKHDYTRYVLEDVNHPTRKYFLIHKIKMPNYGERNWYASILSADGFSNRTSKKLYKLMTSKKRKLSLRESHPHCLYSIKTKMDFDSWKKGNDRVQEICKDDGKVYKYKYINHDSIWDFYKHIKYDHKKDRYYN